MLRRFPSDVEVNSVTNIIYVVNNSADPVTRRDSHSDQRGHQ